jgi:predicted regulator of Ras-like GTPase activity (Roadblock/LC7/MglB family)
MADWSDIDERIAKCLKILDENPSSQIFAALAEAYRKKGDLDKAFRVCQNGLKIHPNYGSAHLVMSKINLDKGMYDWAEAEVEKAVELDGATRTTELLLSEVFIYKGEFNKACRLLERLHHDDPENDQIKRLLDIARKIPLDTDHSGSIPTLDARRTQAAARPAPSFSRTVPTPSRPTPAAARPLETADSLELSIVPEIQLPDAPLVAANLNFRQMLKSLVSTPGVDGALVSNKDGLVVDAEWNVPGETDLIGALAVEAARHSAAQMRETGYGTLQAMMIETDDRLLYLAGAKGKILTVICSDTVNLGSLKLKLGNLLPRLAG